MQRDPASRDAILEAAERLFASRGFTATTIKDIGREAGVNSALLYYYFRDKDDLYGAVLDDVFSRLAQHLRQALDEATTASESVAALVGAQVAVMAHHPSVPHLLVREMIDHHGLRARDGFGRISAGVFARICEVIRSGQRSGEFRADLVPEFAAISTISQVAYFFIARPAMGILLGHGPEGPPPEAVQRYGVHAAAFALGALGATGDSNRLATGARA